MTAREVHRLSIRVLSIAMAIVGVALIVESIGSNGVALIRLLMGVLFVAAGSGRLYLQMRGGGSA